MTPTIQGETRHRDLTPTEDPAFEAMGKSMRPDWEPLLPEGQRMGRAPQFLDFLEHELMPFLRRTYPIEPESTTLMGSSLGGLFATYALLERPALFKQYIVISPSLWWQDEVMFAREAQRATELSELPARAYFAVGAQEEGPELPWLARWKLVTNTRRMAETLTKRGYPSLNVELSVIEGETHTSVVPVAMTRALRAFCRPPTR